MVTDKEMGKVLETALSGGGDFAELFFEDKDELNIKCTQKVLKGITTVHILVPEYMCFQVQKVYMSIQTI